MSAGSARELHLRVYNLEELHTLNPAGCQALAQVALFIQLSLSFIEESLLSLFCMLA